MDDRPTTTTYSVSGAVAATRKPPPTFDCETCEDATDRPVCRITQLARAVSSLVRERRRLTASRTWLGRTMAWAQAGAFFRYTFAEFLQFHIQIDLG
jgi:hypothetical protein